MFPILLELGPITLYSYGLMIATAFFVALSLAAREGKKEGIDPQITWDLGFYMLIGIIVGSRLLFVLAEAPEYLKDPVKILKIWEGGLVFYGGVLMTIVIAVVYLKKHGINVWKMADIYAPSIALGQGIGRWGCFLAGCCYGRETDVPWAVVFTNPSSLAPTDIHIHPTQIYDSLNGFILFAILWTLKKRKKFDGQIFWIYSILYAVTRFVVEYFRGDDRGGLLLANLFSTSQFIGVSMILISLYMLYRLKGEGIKPAIVKQPG